MDDKELRSYEMLMRVDNYGGGENGSSFPPASLGGELFARIKAAVTKLADHVAQQVSGSTSARQGTATKAMAREALRDDLERPASHCAGYVEDDTRDRQQVSHSAQSD